MLILTERIHWKINISATWEYTEENLRERMTYAIEMQIAYGTTRLDTCIDAAPKLPEDGLIAIRIALELKEKFKDRIAIRIATPSIWGKLLTGTPLNEVDISTVGGVLHEDRKACIRVGPPGWQSAVE